MSYSESRARYAEVLDSVVDDREEIVITRAGRDPVVIISLDEVRPTSSANEAPVGRAGVGGPPVVAGPGPQGPPPHPSTP
ncbi:MAG: type II toxin-antitoxin system Phd/YefM family antitoxin [Pseudonocardia sp.]|nr:type II toxin-antitoxin system Phd/YefM family antitoxin [Pseudonocardia sp.]